ncbi:MAG: hypothetical protein K9M80_06025 [Candidatus Marinimicrobia bacterium]|nr:hypothetical protein [Candidatus Neomarinimicrobiota bacterium]
MNWISKNSLKNNQTNIIIITIFNVIITILFYLFYLKLIKPAINTTQVLPDSHWFNSIILIVPITLIYYLTAQIISSEYWGNKNAEYIKTLSEVSYLYYIRKVLNLELILVLQSLLTIILSLFLITPEINYFTLLLYIFYIIFAGIFFINLGCIMGFFSKKSTLKGQGIGLIIIMLFLIGGFGIAVNHHQILGGVIKYLPTSIVLSGGAAILKPEFGSFLIPFIYILVLNIVTIFITYFILNKNDY